MDDPINLDGIIEPNIPEIYFDCETAWKWYQNQCQNATNVSRITQMIHSWTWL